MFSTAISVFHILFLVFPAILLGGSVAALFLVWRSKPSGTRPATSPVSVNFSELEQAVQAAWAGNSVLFLQALEKSFEVHFAQGDKLQLAVDLALKELQRRVTDPSVPAPAIEMLAKLGHTTEQAIMDLLKRKFSAPTAAPAPADAVAQSGLNASLLNPVNPLITALALALLLGLSGSAEASYPLYGSWGADVTAPQRFYATDTRPIIDEPIMSPVVYVPQTQSQYAQPPETAVTYYSVQGPDGCCYQSNYCCNQRGDGFWQAGPARRIISAPVRWWRNGNHPIARGAGRILSAPFRWLFR